MRGNNCNFWSWKFVTLELVLCVYFNKVVKDRA